MNGEYTNIKYPRIERVAKGGEIVTYEIIGSNIEQDSLSDSCEFRAPYLENVVKEALRNRGNLENVILVTESEPVAVKCALFLLQNEPLLMAERKFTELEQIRREDDPYGIYDEYQYEYEPNEYTLQLVRLADGPTIKDIPINMCMKVLATVEADAVMYEGLTTNEYITDKIEAILADDRQRKYLWITPEQKKEPWVNKLRAEFGYSLLQIKNVPEEYYERVFSHILQESGYALEDGIAEWDIVNQLMKLFGKEFDEEYMEWMLQNAIHEKKQHGDVDFILTRRDFSMNSIPEKNAFDRLADMPGLGEMKEVILEQTALRREIKRNPLLKGNHNHMIFYGNPGTGKTTCARLMAEIMADYGVKNPVFVEAARSDIIGQYVGQTAKKITDLFEKARGGILFVDESGFFLNTGAGGYVTEAIKEFVRYMENCPDVMVVFAMYEKEAEAFLKLDEGLASRISRMVEFRDYSHEELLAIFNYMVKENGYRIEKDALKLFGDYIDGRKQDKHFGNARDVRKVFESTVIQHSVQNLNSKKITDLLSLEDVKNGISKLRKAPRGRKEFGFQYSSLASGTAGNLAVNN